MDFFSTRDVLEWEARSPPTEVVTVPSGEPIRSALGTMLDNDFDQLPVEEDSRITGVVSYRSIARVLKSFGGTDIAEQNVGVALEDPVFVDPDRDVYDLFETLAEDDYVLVGTPRHLEGIMTRYDVFLFLEDRVRPFLLIGEIEVALRQLFEAAVEDLEDRIGATFAGRADNDDTYSPPERVEEFGFWEYHTFVASNWEALAPFFGADRSFVLTMIDDLGSVRNALFHFREGVGEVDRDLVRIAHVQVLSARDRALS